MHFLLKNYKIILICLTSLAAFFNFYNLSWGSPFYFHPDERNIASSISTLRFPQELNPYFFAYGSLPIYKAYFLGMLQNIATNKEPFNIVTFEQAIMNLRFFSATFATLLVPLLFLIGSKLKDQVTGLIAAFFATFSMGLIQYAHFGTFELWLTFLGLLLFYCHLLFWKTQRKIFLILMSFIFGLLLATKISSLALLPLILINPNLISKKIAVGKVLKAFSHICFILIFSFTVFFLTNPFTFLDFSSFLNSFLYESSVATGSMIVFYTGEFLGTLPVLYHLLHIYPFLLNPLIYMVFIPSFLYVLYLGIKNKNNFYLLLVTYFLFLFLTQTFLFVKWTRYVIPTLPFIYLLVAIFIQDIYQNKKLKHFNFLKISTATISVFVCILFAISFIFTVHSKQDTRVTAANWASENIPHNNSILSEVYDLGITAFTPPFSQINLFNFYDLDNNSPEYNSQTLATVIENSDYFILPSQRIIKVRLNNPKNFPEGNSFYSSLVSDQIEYTKIYETPCDIFCKITYWGDPINNFEGTANIFDRPTIYIYQINDKL